MHPHQRLLLLPVVHRLLPAQRAMRHGLAELGQRIVGVRPLGQAAAAVDEVSEHDQSPLVEASYVSSRSLGGVLARGGRPHAARR
jgi:hypothetical protein